MSGGTPWTRGPWVVNPICAQIDSGELSADGSLLPIAQLLWPTDERTEDETFANGRLAAASPEMADAIAEVICALSWINEQAENAMAISSGCANTHGDAGGGLEMLNSTASDIGINATMQMDKLGTLLTKIGATQ